MLVTYDLATIDEPLDYEPYQKFLEFATRLKFLSKDKGEIMLSPSLWFNTQKVLIKSIFKQLKENSNARDFVILKARQLGITTIMEAFDLYYAMKIPNIRGVIVGNVEDVVEGIRTDIAKYMYKSLPNSRKLHLLINSRNKTIFSKPDNPNAYGSFLEYKHPSVRGNRGNLGRSKGYNYAHLTEIAYYPNIDDINSLLPTFSTEFEKRLYIYESTANGFNFFQDKWENAKSSNTANAIFLGWWLKDTYAIYDDKDLAKYGKDPNEKELQQIKAVKKLYNWDITINQLAWYRKYKEELLVVPSDTNLDKENYMLEIYPYTEYDAFKMSARQYFPSTVFSNPENVTPPVEEYEPIFFQEVHDTYLKRTPAGKFKVWERPLEDVKYVCAADPAWSVNPDSDNSVFTVLKCFQDKAVQVAEFASNTIPLTHFTWLFLIVSGWYNAMINFEIVGGGEAMKILLDNYKSEVYSLKPKKNYDGNKIDIYEYWKNLGCESNKKVNTTTYLYKRVDSLAGSHAIAWVTTANNKERIMLLLREAILNNKLIINSPALLNEMKYFVKDERRLGAIKGHDDRVMALALAYNTFMEKIRKNALTEEQYLKRKEGAPIDNDDKSQFLMGIINKQIKKQQIINEFLETNVSRG